MIRTQRSLHALIWSALAIALAMIVIGALVAREGAVDAARAIVRGR
ncbi:MAG: hypothetical protein JNJ73_00070 [Hyphomonadaceae bacterium]|nr:hypothetical protein [Hyphomonadaceae bacterium]